jgi:transcriptional regulator with XRE-family HTH domain
LEDKDFIGHAIGLFLRKRREELGLTQAQVAERADTSEKHLGKLERGQRYPSGILLVKLLVALKVSILDIHSIMKEAEELKRLYKR